MTTRRRLAVAASLACAAGRLFAQEPTAPPLDAVASPYREARGLGWDAPADDPDDATIPLLIESGGDRLRIDLAVTVAGEPFRRPRGRLAAALAAAAESARNGGETAPAKIDGLDETAAAQVAEYLRVNGGEVNPDEVRWLLAELLGGPPLLTVADGRQPPPADPEPLFAALDADADGVLGRDELSAAAPVLMRSDRNGDEAIVREELADARSTPDDPPPSPTLTVVAESGPPPTGGPPTESGPVAAPKPAAVVRCRVAFGTVSEVTIESPDAAEGDSFAVDGGRGFRWRGHVVIVSASAEMPAAPSDEMRTGLTEAIPDATQDAISTDQVSIGLAGLGRGLFAVVDADADGRITRREAAGAAERLASLDANLDGAVALREVPAVLHLAVARGPYAHRRLRRTFPPVWVGGPRDRPAGNVPAPEWFAAMDANGDGDLSRAEFLGSDEQFRALDADGDGLIGAGEAAAAETSPD